jgi:hypothetical protein
LDYLWKHKKAEDTLAGVAQWWLLRQRIERMIKKTKTAIDELMSRGLVLKAEAPGRQPTYRINRAKARKIQTLLKDAQGVSEA